MLNTSKIPRSREQLLLFFSAAIFCIFLGHNKLFDWDEINFAESAREMLVTGDWFRVQINYEPFWEKPPLFFWLEALSMYFLGENAFAARLPNAIIGGMTLIALYRVGTHLRDITLGRLMAGLYFASLLPHLYFKSGIIDPLFNLFIFLGLVQVIRYEMIASETRWLLPWELQHQRWAGIKAGFWMGLATLTKGPVALLMLLITYPIFAILFNQYRFRWGQILLFSIAYMVVVGSWFGLETYMHGDGFIQKFIDYQIELFTQPVAGHDQPFYYHFVVFFIGCFPMSLFVIAGMGMIPERYAERQARRYMMIWFWTILILFSLSQTKIIHYSSMAYFPGVYLAACFLYHQLEENTKFPLTTWVLYSLHILILGVGTTLLLYYAPFIQDFAAYIKDVHVLDAMRIPIRWTYYEWLIGLFFGICLLGGLVLLIFRKTTAFITLFVIATPIFLNLLNYWIIPKASLFTQTSAVNFWIQKQNHGAYLIPYGYKSYAHYFYGKVLPENSLKNTVEWAINEQQEKLVYIACKLKAAKEFEEKFHKKVRFLYQQGGFRFYEKKIFSK